jgi:hypothetical protein
MATNINMDKINKIFAEILGEKALPRRRRNSLRYFKPPKKLKPGTWHYLIGYTPWKTRGEDGKLGFYAVKYRPTRKGYTLAKAVRFRTRRKAAERARQWYKQTYQSKEVS